MDAKDLIKQVKEDEIKFVSLQFTDVTGTVKSVDMPISGLEARSKTGCGSMARRWKGSPAFRKAICICGSTRIPTLYCPGLLGTRRARSSATSSCPMASLLKGTRGVLKRLMAKIAERGWTYNIGPEPEVLLVQGRERARSSSRSA